MTHTITNQYLAHHAGISLRVHRARHVERNRDLRGAEGVLLSVAIGTAVIAWTVAFIRWFL
jgi:hypothetical protein